MKLVKLLVVLIVALSTLAFYQFGRQLWVPVYKSIAGRQTVSEVLERHAQDTKESLASYFSSAGVAYPPEKLTLLAIKDEDTLELWAFDDGEHKFIRSYPVLAASGVLGPKLKEGDRQVPEGIYKLEYLNPNSAYHLSMKLNYPNSFDLEHAKAEGRTEPGTNIFIHGKAVSIGCLAMGDEAIEELFVLTALVGKDAVTVAIAPKDPRKHNLAQLTEGKPEWVADLYGDITDYFETFKR